MKKRFADIDSLHAYIEKKARQIIRHYYTDWKNYDRPSMMKATGAKEKEVYVILRDCGSYFYLAEELTDPTRDFPITVMDYYTSDKSARYFKVNFRDLVIEEITPGIPAGIATARKAREAALARIA